MIEIVLRYGKRLITRCCFKELHKNRSIKGLVRSKADIVKKKRKKKRHVRDPGTSVLEPVKMTTAAHLKAAANTRSFRFICPNHGFPRRANPAISDFIIMSRIS